MKKYILILLPFLAWSFNVAAQTMSSTNPQIKALWQKYTKYAKDNRSADAIKTLSIIEKEALTNGDQASAYKAITLRHAREENTTEKTARMFISELEDLLPKLSEPYRSLIHTKIADRYQQAAEHIIYATDDVEQTENDSENTEQASKALKQKALDHILKSIENYEALTKQNGSVFDNFIEPYRLKQLKALGIQQNLYHALVQNAIDFIENNLDDEETSDAYKTNDIENTLIAPYQEFLNADLKSITQSKARLILQIYQKALSISNRAQKEEFSYLDFLRTQYVLDEFFLDNNLKRKQVYEQFRDSQTNTSAAGLALAEQIELYKEIGSTENDEEKNEQEQALGLNNINQAALDLCQQLAAYNNPQLKKAANSFKKQILAKDLRLTTEQVLLPNKSALALATYKNCTKIKIVILPQKSVTRKYGTSVKMSQLKATNKIVLERVYTFNQCTDYTYNQVEFALPPLPLGEYELFTFLDTSLTAQSVQNITVSDLDFQSVHSKNNNLLRVISRSSGQAITGAKISFYRREYSPKQYKEANNLLESVTSSSNKLTPIPANCNYIRISSGQDALERYINVYENVSSTPPTKTQTGFCTFLTDRNIYRPGQQLKYKVILQNHNRDIAIKQKIKVQMIDGNDQVVQEATLTSNEYGSASGEFKIPTQGFNGRYYLRCDNDYVGREVIRVEEYKRPRFEVVLSVDSVQRSFDNEVIVKGKALTYSGAPLSNAEVTYTVHRQQQMRPWWYGSYGRNYGRRIQISQGELKTDNLGNFEIKYIASSNGIKNKSLGIYNFTCDVTVQDINGEIHQAENSIAISKQAMQLDIITNELNDLNDTSAEIKLSATNLDGKQINTKVWLEIKQSTQSDKLVKNRPWEIPEYTLITPQQYETEFQFDQKYEDPKSLPILISKEVQANESIELSNLISKPGIYYVKVWQKVNGDTIELQRKIEVINSNIQPLKSTELFVIEDTPLTFNNNKSFTCRIYSRYDNVQALCCAVGQNKNQVLPIALNKGWNTITFEALDATNTKIRVFALANYANNTYEESRVYYKENNKPRPKITLATFRNKIIPGSIQNFTAQITGIDEKSASQFEVLATMYDASLDALYTKHSYVPLTKELEANYYSGCYFNRYANRLSESELLRYTNSDNLSDIIGYHTFAKLHDRSSNNGYVYAFSRGSTTEAVAYSTEGRPEAALPPIPSQPIRKLASVVALAKDHGGVARTLKREEVLLTDSAASESKPARAQNSVRTNLQETAFFIPHIKSSKRNEYSWEFTAPEALSAWRILLFAHDTSAASAITSEQIITQKDIMVTPNLPRYLFGGDNMTFSVKINNLSNSAQKGTLKVSILDADSKQDITNQFIKNPEQAFAVDAQNNVERNVAIAVPKDFTSPIIVRTVAVADKISDGEQSLVPVLTTMQVQTEAQAITLTSGAQKSRTLKALSTLKPEQKPLKLSVENTSRPAFHTLHTLVYLNDYPLDCTEQLASKLYALKLLQYMRTKDWVNTSNLQKLLTDTANTANDETLNKFKQITLNETPWVMQTKSEREQRIQLARALNEAMNNQALDQLIDKIISRQANNGGFAWFSGMRESEWVTLSVLERIVYISELVDVMGAKDDEASLSKLTEPTIKVLKYLDSKFLAREKERQKQKPQEITYSNELHYLTTRLRYNKIGTKPEVEKLWQKCVTELLKQWQSLSLENQAQLALCCLKLNKNSEAQKIATAIAQNAVVTEERGMYWKQHGFGGADDLSLQALILELFTKTKADQNIIDNTTLWLLLHKQNNYWSNTNTSAQVVHRLLNTNTNNIPLGQSDITIQLGNQKINANQYESTAGAAQQVVSFTGNAISPNMATITAKNSGASTVFSNVYFQYLSPIALIEKNAQQQGLSIAKEYFVVNNTPQGQTLSEATNSLKVGDKVRVRLTIQADRPMSFVHIKDQRAACFEPIDVLSDYKYGNGIGYYMITKDASTNFFIDDLARGKYTLEYDVFVNSSGEYTDGLSSIQSMYAPEYTANSAGAKVIVKGK